MFRPGLRRIVTTYIMDEQGRFLLLLHGIAKLWMPPGGKVEPGELDHEAAIREVKEETGLDIDLGSSHQMDVWTTQLPMPMYVQLEELRGECYQNQVYFYRQDDPFPEVVIRPDETIEARWMSLEDMRHLPEENVMQSVVKNMAHIRYSVFSMVPIDA